MDQEIINVVNTASVQNVITRSQLASIIDRIKPYLAYEFNIYDVSNINMKWFYIWVENNKIYIES